MRRGEGWRNAELFGHPLRQGQRIGGRKGGPVRKEPSASLYATAFFPEYARGEGGGLGSSEIPAGALDEKAGPG